MAIALDATSHSTSPGSSTSPLTWTHIGGTPSVVFVGVAGDNTTTAVTYGGTSMTQVGTNQVDSAGNSWSSLWVLFSPAAGSQTVSVTHGGSVYAMARSLTGTASSLDSSNQGATSVDATSFAQTTTVVATGCYLVGVASDERDAGCGTQSMTSGTLDQSSGDIRNNGLNQFGGILGYRDMGSNTGAQSMTFNSTQSVHWTTILASIAPGASATTVNSLSLLGVG